MTQLWPTLLLIALVVSILKWVNRSDLDKALKITRANGSIAAIVDAVLKEAKPRQATLWDQAIGTLWREYRRDEAFQLMIAAAERSDAPIVQYWLKNAMDVEPELATRYFTEEFLTHYFQPRVAASCGRCGCSK